MMDLVWLKDRLQLVVDQDLTGNGVGVGYLDEKDDEGYRSCNALLILDIEVTTYNSSAFWSLPLQQCTSF